MRKTTVRRLTNETDIRLELNLDGPLDGPIHTGIGFLDHMLTLFERHSGFGLSVMCVADFHVDDHHGAEDIGICLGQAFDELLGERKGIVRYGSATIPMDEALVLTAADFSGRGYLAFDLPNLNPRVGGFDTELVKEFFWAFCREAKATVHVRGLAGENTHHIIEAAFKSFARSLKQAAAIDASAPDSVPSTKGTLTGKGGKL